ncbi:hypothetical protein [Halorientalis litorea]|uniref:hypothetical protein n=1 Tax=Halorientalis litorea TaxID=2931977 RepID=UPI001FF4A4FA|nr:hypothetical protein [Halorientalis litorea]
MKYKVAPEPVALAVLRDAHAAVPLVPESTDDCCARIVDRTDVATRADADAWLPFLDALGLATRTDRGYRRERREVDPDALAAPFRDNVFGVAAVLDALADADGPLSAAETFERVREVVPTWERNRHADWEGTWTVRVARLLDWAVVFGLATRTGEGYTA